MRQACKANANNALIGESGHCLVSSNRAGERKRSQRISLLCAMFFLSQSAPKPIHESKVLSNLCF
jgi:hypothetical protein